MFAGSRRETAYLVALASVINVVPKALYISQMPSVSADMKLPFLTEKYLQLIPLLIRGLDLEDSAIRVDIINTLSNIIDAATDGDTPLSSHASTLVLVMLKNSAISDMPDPVSNRIHRYACQQNV